MLTLQRSPFYAVVGALTDQLPGGTEVGAGMFCADLQTLQRFQHRRYFGGAVWADTIQPITAGQGSAIGTTLSDTKLICSHPQY